MAISTVPISCARCVARLYLNLIQCRPLQTRGIQAKRVEIDAGEDAEVLIILSSRSRDCTATLLPLYLR